MCRYKENWFGLRTLDALDRIDRLSTPGNHLEFSEEFLFGLVDQYFTTDAVTAWMVPSPSTDGTPNDAMVDPAPVRFHGFWRASLTLAVRRIVGLGLSPWVCVRAASSKRSLPHGP